MTLKQLEAFYWAASAASFLVAAERLHVSQSTLSKRISELEAQLRTPLFDRSGHRAVLTEAGEQLLPLARRMLGLADDMRALVAGSGGARGHCRFGVGHLPPLLRFGHERLIRDRCGIHGQIDVRDGLRPFRFQCLGQGAQVGALLGIGGPFGMALIVGTGGVEFGGDRGCIY